MGESALDVLEGEHDKLRELFVQVRDPARDRVKVWLEIVKQTTIHVAVERSFIYPLVKSGKLGSHDLAAQLLGEYKRMEHLLVLTERRKINSPDMPELVTALLDAFEAHRERCENVLVPAMRDRLTQDELDELGHKMRAAGNIILSHPHPHLLALGPVYQWTTRIASAWDRRRDRWVQNR